MLKNTLKYRKDIDGLRSIAVMLVVLYHFGFTGITGGFVGVDVFFVISGFLITQIIAKQVANGTFSFKQFYTRRIKRLMPAMLAMVSITFVVFSFVLLPSDYEMLASSIIYVSGYLANIFFWQEYGGYFAGATQEAPLLHTWSLAVEEQFYVFWPVFILLTYRWLGATKTIYVTLFLTVGAVFFSEYANKVTIGAAYYLLPTRAYELMIGALLALSWKNLPNPNKPTADLLSVGGLLMILYSAFTLSKADTFPGFNALLPTIGTAFLIYSHRVHQGIINNLLSNNIAVFIGLISYSLYLWHWPIIVMINYMDITLSLFGRIALVALAIFIATLSFYFIEKPMRTTKASDKNVVLLSYATPSVLLIVICSAVLFNNGFKQRFSEEVNAMDYAINTHSNVLRNKCHASLAGATNQPNDSCVLGKVDGNISGYLVGDSHANHYSGFIDELAKYDGARVQDHTLDRCPPIFGLRWGKSEFKAEQCYLRNKINKEHILETKPDFVVLAASWPNERSTMAFDEISGKFVKGAAAVNLVSTKLNETIQFLDEQGIKTILLTDTPYIDSAKYTCPIKKALFNDALDCQIHDSRNNFLTVELEDLTKKYATLKVIEPRDVICSNDKCSLSLNGVPLYRDIDHLNDLGSREIAKEYLKSHDGLVAYIKSAPL